MKNIINFLLATLLSTISVFASHDIYSSPAPAAGMAIFMIILFLFVFVFAILGTIFWIFMLVDCAKREFDSKVAWILILALTGVIGAILYYFIVKRK